VEGDGTTAPPPASEDEAVLFQATPAELAAWDAAAEARALPVDAPFPSVDEASATPPPPAEGALDPDGPGAVDVPEVSPDEIEEVVEAFVEQPPAGSAAFEPPPPSTPEAGPTPPPHDDDAEVVSLDEIVITPPPPMAEALAPPLPLPSGAAAATGPPPLPAVAPPVLLPRPPSPAGGTVPEAPPDDLAARFPEPAPDLFAPPPEEAPPPVRAAGPATGDLSPGADAAATPMEHLSAPPPEESWGGASSFVAGEHRVVLHTVEGQVLRGSIADVDLVDAEVGLRLPGGDVQQLPASRLKAVFFMLAPGEASPAGLGTRVRVTFGDGRQVAGMSPDYSPSAPGCFVVPVESRTNTGRIWVYREAIRQVSVG
jgi:hypothetical protein